MPLYSGIDLHANNRVIVVLNEQDEVIYRKRLSNDLPMILQQLGWRQGFWSKTHGSVVPEGCKTL